MVDEEWREAAERAFDLAEVNKNRIITINVSGSRLCIKYFTGEMGDTHLRKVEVPLPEKGAADSVTKAIAQTLCEQKL